MKIKRMTFLRTSCSTPFAIWREQKKGVASDRAQTNLLFLIAMTRLQILVSQWIGILICVSLCSCDIPNYLSRNGYVCHDDTRLGSETTYIGENYVQEGSSLVILCCTIYAKDIKWTRDDQVLLKEEADQTEWDENGILVERLAIANISARHAGDYRCNTFSLDVYHRVVVVSDINTSEPEEGSGLILKVGHDFSVSCNVTSVPEEENLPVVWFKDGYQLNATDNIQINNNSIYIKTTVIGDTGEYTCAVNLPNLNLSKSIMVRSQPRLKELGKSKNHVQGDKMTLKCESEGNPIPKLTWFLNDKNLSDPNHADERIEITFDEEKGIAELTIKELEENDRADYMCIAENVVGSANITILVRVKDKLAALWPFLGIVAEVAVLCTIIFIYEKRRAKQEYDESDTDQSPDTKNVSENKDKDVRQRK